MGRMGAKENRSFFLHVSHNLRALTLRLSSSTSFSFELYRRNINIFNRGNVKGDEVGTCAINGDEVGTCAIKGDEVGICAIKGDELRTCAFKGDEVGTCH
jgi:hypothetical protein